MNRLLRKQTIPIGKSGIHIKPENRGKFTRLKKRTGKSASWFKAHGTPAQKKMATFALNARKWKHESGGIIKAQDGTKIFENRYNMVADGLQGAGYNDEATTRLTPFLTSQSLLEAGWIEPKDNNYGGHLSKGERIRYPSKEAFWTKQVNLLKRKWPNFDKAENIDQYLDSLYGKQLYSTDFDYKDRVKGVYKSIPKKIEEYRNRYLSQDFTTKLTPEEEEEFQKWYATYATINGLSKDPDKKEHYYDYRGYWKNESRPAVLWGEHLPDTYKRPGHSTFSIESKYSSNIARGGRWEEHNIPERDSDKFIDSEFTKTYNNEN